MKYFNLMISIPIILLIGCEFKKADCYTKLLEGTKKNKQYTLVMGTALREIPTLKNRENRKVITDSSYILSSLIDEVVFFNSKQDKCLILLLQKTAGDLKLDQVKIIQGTLTTNNWMFSSDRLPDIPEITFTVDKPEVDGKLVNNEFKVLADKGREFVLKAGSSGRKECELDETYWFGD